MVGKIRLAVASGLAMLASAVWGGTNNVASAVSNDVPMAAESFPAYTNNVASTGASTNEVVGAGIVSPAILTSIRPFYTNDVRVVELRGDIPYGNTNHYAVYSCPDLKAKDWKKSALNTNIYSETGRGLEFYVQETAPADRTFYGLGSP